MAKTTATKASTKKPAGSKKEYEFTASAKGKRLVIVESPSKARTINKYLGKDFTVFASVGHIKELPKKEIGLDFNHQYEPRYDTIEGKEKIVREMKKLAKESSEILIATDPDREGEAIAWHIANEVAEAKKPTARVLFNEITQKAVREAIDKPRQIDYDLVRSQQARQAVDKIVGYKVSPFLWNTVLRGISAGRVQSVALRLICEREDEIDAFITKEYWSIIAEFITKTGDKVSAKLVKIDGKDFELSNEADAKAAAEKIKSRLYSILEIRKRKVRRNPPPPFTTSLLQQAASNQLGYGSKSTMRLAQQLYEGIELGEGAVGLITYMRTDSKRVSKEAQDEARNFIAKQFGPAFMPETAIQYKTSESSQDAHEAIRPTSVDYTPKSVEAYLTKEQFKLYDLIWKRFVASQMSAAELEQTSVDIGDDKRAFLFRASGSVILFEGFLKIFGDQRELDYEERKSTKDDGESDSEDRAILPKNLNEKDPMKLGELKENQHFTKPPARYSEASLVKELDNYGIGRPSTYASILSTLVERTYVENRQRRLFPSILGRDVSKILVANFADLFNTEFTAGMETNLDKIAVGEDDYVSVLDKFYLPFEKALALRTKDPILPQNANAELCDKCGVGRMQVKWTKSGKFLGCTRYPKCDNIKSLNIKKAAPPETGIHCLKCETGRMVARTGRFGKFLACTNYPTCDGLLNVDKFGKVAPPKVPALMTDIPCPKCTKPLVLRDGKRGYWLGCSNFPKCRGRKPWADLTPEDQEKWEKELHTHYKAHPLKTITMMDGSPLDLTIKLDDLIAAHTEPVAAEMEQV
jgi:DNA topoisomerase I